MITKIERKALETRQENPETLAMIRDLHRKTDGKMKLTYPDGRQKVVSGTGMSLQKLKRYCDDQGVGVELEGVGNAETGSGR